MIPRPDYKYRGGRLGAVRALFVGAEAGILILGEFGYGCGCSVSRLSFISSIKRTPA